MSLEDELASERRGRENVHRARSLEPPELAPGDAPIADFVTNDYLGLARDPALAAAAAEAARRYGAGARAARLLGGGCELDRVAERLVADWLGAEDALLFPSGYQANLGWLPALVGRDDWVASDELAHASLIDGARLAGARVAIYRHADTEHLASLFAEARGARRRLVVTEGVFSMDGDRAPLERLAEVCSAHGARLIVDEAHSAGVIGPEGRGAWAAANVRGAAAEALLARIVTGGKALGAAGAFVVGARVLCTHLVDRARSFVFTTGVAPAVSGALVAAIPRARAAEVERATLAERARELARALELPEPEAAIIPLPVGDDTRALELARALHRERIDARAVRPPTVPEGTARLRLVCHAHNTPEEIARLVAALRRQGVVRPSDPSPAPAARTARVIVVVGTDTNVGKTVASAVLLHALARSGAAEPLAYWKPVQTGSECDTQAVAAMTVDRALEQHEPCYRFALAASPHEAAAAQGDEIQIERIDAELARHRARGGTLVIELAGGLLVPWNDRTLQVDWLERLGAAVLVVARSGLGTLNHTLLTVEALRRRRLAPGALWLVGPRHTANRATLAERTGLPIGELPLLTNLGPTDLARAVEVLSLPLP